MQRVNEMRKWIWILPAVFVAACSRNNGTPVTAVVPGENPETVAAAPAPPPAASAVQTPAPGQLPGDNPTPAGLPVGSRPLARTGSADRMVAEPASVIPRGTRLRVRIDNELDTRHNQIGDRFTASLYQPVVLNGRTVLPVGTRFHGHLVTSKPSGRLKGRAAIGLTLDSFESRGRQYAVDTNGDYRDSSRHRGQNMAFVGGGSAGGAAIGAAAGGGSGAAIGAVVGGGAGLAGALITGRKHVTVRSESPMTFTLRAPVPM